jgi:hypothetical protein
MTQDELLTAVKHSLALCAGFEGDAIATDRKRALDYYFQRARGDEVPGRSAVISGDLSAMVEASLAQMLDAFSSEHIAEFDPLGPEDEDQAELESDAVQYFVMSKANGFLELAQAIKDALLLRNGIMKVWVEERRDSTTRTLRGVTEDALPTLLTIPGTEVKVLKYDPEAGELRMRITSVKKRFRCEALPLENFLYVADWDSLELQMIPFCAERHVDRRSDLIELGFAKSKVEELSKFGSNTKPDAAARNPRSLQTPPAQGSDPSQDAIEWFECYALIDADEDGIAERHRVCLSGNTLLKDEPTNVVPYAAGAALLAPHRFTGISLYDKLKQVQDTNTGLQRALMDNVNTTTKNRLAYLDGKVNVDDISDGRPNGGIRVKANVADIRAAVMPFAVPDTSANILANIEFQKSVRSEMGGAALDLQTATMQIGGDRMGSQGLDRAYSVVEQLCAMQTRFIAATLIRSTFLLAHQMLRDWYSEPVPIKRNGKWFSPIPAQWPLRQCVTVRVGMSAGERARKAGSLMVMLQQQAQLAQYGMEGVLVNLPGFYRTLTDWARVSDIRNPEQYLVDPESAESRQAMQAKNLQAAQARGQQQQLMSQALGLEQLRTAFEKYKTDAELQFKYYDAVLSAEVEEAKIAGSATAELLKAKAQGKAKTNGNGSQAPRTSTEVEPAASGDSQ